MASETLAGAAEAVLEVKKSRHRAKAQHVADPDAAMAFIAAVGQEAATHHCWAYRIGQAYRFSDDGEPSGTAGRPILAAIDGQGMDEVVVVVTRWYGGIKLGAGGLVRAYGGAASEALRTAARRPLVAQSTVVLRADFAQAQTLHLLLASFDALKLDEQFDADGLRIKARIATDAIDALAERLNDTTRGQGRLERED